MQRTAPVLLAALLAAVPGATQAANQAAPRSGSPTSPGEAAVGDCALRYSASLKRIGEENLPAMKAASTAPGATVGIPDLTLPGTLIFVSRPRPRSQGEIAALTAAVALARSKGASAAVSGQDGPWIGQRLREDLADYLGQKPTPFLCSGVKDYVRTLRSYAVRLGPVADHRREWTETQRAATERSLAAAFEAIRLAKPVAVTASTSVAIPPPAAGAQPAGAAVPPAPAPVPPKPALEPVALATPEDLVAAVDKLVAAAREAGLIAMPVTAGTLPSGLDLSSHPVLAKLASEKPLVMSARPAIRDQPARLKVLSAFADIEMLDYLLEAKAGVEDPLAKALDKTLDDIEAAHASDCTCVP